MMRSQIGNFKILEKLGEGGMGEVYKGLDTTLEREIAIKVLRPEFSKQADIVARFRSEAIALARLNHPNIAMLHAFHEDSGQAYMVMEFVPGQTIAQIMSHTARLPWNSALGLINQVLCGLGHAHGKNIIHRDIKPSNIMLTSDGTVKIMDFGIARILERSRMTKTGFLVGTLPYMSPEQIQGKEADPRSDLYSAGLVLYKMLSGKAPFDKQSDYETIKAQVEEIPGSLSEWVPELEPQIDHAVTRALAKNPADRFVDAEEFRKALVKIQSAPKILRAKSKALPDLIETEILPPAVIQPRRALRLNFRLVISLVFLLAMTASGWLYFDYSNPEKPHNPDHAFVDSDAEVEKNDPRVAQDPAQGPSEPQDPDPVETEPAVAVSPETASPNPRPQDSEVPSSEPENAQLPASEKESSDPDTLNPEDSKHAESEISKIVQAPPPDSDVNSSNTDESQSEFSDASSSKLNFPLPSKDTHKPKNIQSKSTPERINRLPLVNMPSK